MDTNRKLSISKVDQPVLIIQRAKAKSDRLVYFLVANKSVKYRLGKSPIMYIGRTSKGGTRYGQSALQTREIMVDGARREEHPLERHGVTKIGVYTFVCPKGDTDDHSWLNILERACILTFRNMYGDIPLYNKQGAGIKERGEFRRFQKQTIESRIHSFENRASTDLGASQKSSSDNIVVADASPRTSS